MDNLSILDNFNNIKSIQDSIRKRKDYVGDIKTKNPKIYNSWRALMFTEKGNKRGHAEEWNNFRTLDNTVPCCYECNCARNNNFSFEEMKILGKTIKQIKDSRKINY